MFVCRFESDGGDCRMISSVDGQVLRVSSRIDHEGVDAESEYEDEGADVSLACSLFPQHGSSLGTILLPEEFATPEGLF